MCGRFACSLDPQRVCYSCRVKRPDGTVSEPKWVDNPSSPQYRPSTNVAPTNYSPVLFDGRQLAKAGTEDNNERVIMPMRFGLIPSWHKGDEKGMALATMNARVEGITKAKSYSVPLQKGRRCVVLAEGFYEWEKKDDNKTKQPYLIYLPENQEEFQNPKDVQPEDIHLLKLAAVYDVWQSPDGSPVYSYSIITTDSAKSLKWVHNRMPAVLRTEKDVDAWLDTENVPAATAIGLIHPVEDLVFHPVTRAMGNVAYKHADATKPIKMEEAETTGQPLPKGQTTISSFFTPQVKRNAETASLPTEAKPPKTPKK